MTNDITPSYEDLKRAPYPYNELLPGTITFPAPLLLATRAIICKAINAEFSEANAHFLARNILRVTFYLNGASDTDEEPYDSNSFSEILELLDDLPIWADADPDYRHDVNLRPSTDLDEEDFNELSSDFDDE